MRHRLWLKRLLKISLLTGLFFCGFLLRHLTPYIHMAPIGFGRPAPKTSIKTTSLKLICRGAFVRRENPLILRAFSPWVRLRIETENNLKIRLENLLPNSTINGKKISSTVWQTELKTGHHKVSVAPPPLKPPLRILVHGDPEFKTEKKGELFLARLQSLISLLSPHFIIIPGDLVKDNPAMHGYLVEKLAELPLPVYTVAGNHDYNRHTADSYIRHFGPLNYSFCFGGCRFIFFNNADEYLPAFFGDHDLYRVEGLLRHAGCRHLIFVCHKPPVNIGNRNHYMNRPSAADFVSRSLKAAGADLVISGHLSDFYLEKRDDIIYLVPGERAAVVVTLSEDSISVQRVGAPP